MNSQVTCETCGETISGEVFGETSGLRLCGMCADERRERQWEQVDEEVMLDRRDAGQDGDADETDSGEQPASEFSPQVIKRLRFVKWQLASGLIEP